MADTVSKTAGPNETSDKLEENRKNSIRNAFKASRPEPEEDEKSQEKPENENKSEEKLDNDEKNAYINKEEDGESKESEQSDKPEDEQSKENEKYKKIFENQFGQDGVKAAKSWSQAQKEYTKLRQKQQEQEQALNKLDEIVEKNPILEDFIKEARKKGQLTKDDLQSFLKSDREPTGKPNTSSNKSKLGIVDSGFDINDIDEETLAEEGLLNLSKKDALTDSEWELARRQAAVKYAEKNLPTKIADSAFKQFKRQIEDEQEQTEKERRIKKNKQINSERYQQGIEKVVDKFGLDFAGNEEHREMLDEIESRAAYIRDRNNPSVIRENAIYLATIELIEEGQLDVDEATDVKAETERARRNAEQELEEKAGGFNRSASTPTSDGKPKNLADKLRQKRLNDYQKEIETRRKTDRLHKDEK